MEFTRRGKIVASWKIWGTLALVAGIVGLLMYVD